MSTGTNHPSKTNPELHQKLTSLLSAADFLPTRIIVRETKMLVKSVLSPLPSCCARFKLVEMAD